MRRLREMATARPRLTLALWLIATLGLAAQGLSFDSRLQPSSLEVPGTASDDAQQAAARYFGVQASIPVLLEGPPRALESQGRRLVQRLRARPGHQVLSPWDEGSSIPELRPRRDAAMVLVVARARTTFSGETGRSVRDLVDRATQPPVRTAVSGFSVVGGGLKDEALRSTRRAERVAIPLLLIVLLLVFRSPIAALIPALFGVAAVESGYGAVALIATHWQISEVASALTSMMGLALGVDYSLLLVSRFREELRDGASVRDAAIAARAGAGHTVLVAGITLIVAMLVAIALSQGDFLFSVAASVVSVAAISIVGAFVAVPAILVLVGHKIDAWRIGPAPQDGGRWAGLARSVQRRPLSFGALALLPLLVLSAPALGLDTGPPDVRSLPESSRVRQDAERTGRVLGPGWTAPFEVYITDATGPVTTAQRLRAIERWQTRVARWPGVKTVVGPGVIVRREPRLLRAEREADRARASLGRGRHDARRLAGRLDRARTGLGELQGGLRQARHAARRLAAGAQAGDRGAAQLASALRRARTGATTLTRALRQAHGGAEQLTTAIGQARDGADILSTGLRQARRGATRLAAGSKELATGLSAGGDQLGQLGTPARDARTDAERLWTALNTMTIGRADPRYKRALESAGRLYGFTSGKDPRNGTHIDPTYRGLPAAVDTAATQLAEAADAAHQLHGGADQLAGGLRRLHAGAQRLDSGLRKLRRGATQLDTGLQQVASSSADLPVGLARLAAGADRLSAGLGKLETGTGHLAGGLTTGAGHVGRLQDGLGQAGSHAGRAARRSDQEREIARLDDRSPRLLDSGYFVLAALDGGRVGARSQAAYSVSLERGGQAARIVVVPTSGPNDAATRALRDRLQREMPDLARSTQAKADLGGVAAQVTDYNDSLGSRLPLLIVALSIAAAAMLVVVLRAIVLPLISVVLNLLTVGASFGVVALLFQGDPPPLGGPGYADIISLLGTFTIIFGLSLDYQVFILTRMREAWDDKRDLEHAITFGIDRTGRVITGAAAIMGGVFIAFTFSDITVIKQTGIGLATAVLIDATAVRLVLLPAAMRLAGRSTFWLPGWLDRRLPQTRVDTHPARAAAQA